MIWDRIKTWFTRHSLDNPATDLSDDSIFGSDYQTSTGEAISLLKAIGYPAFRQAVTVISGDVAKFPFEPHRIRDDGTTEVDQNDPLYRVTAWMPNSEMDAFTFWRQMMIHAIIFTHSYAVITRDPRSQTVTSLLPLLSDRTHLEIRNGTRMYVSEINGRLETFVASEIFHLRGMCTGDGDDCELLKDTRNTIALGLASQGFASRFFRQGGRIGGILELPAAMKPGAMNTVETGFRKKYHDPNSSFETVILRDNAKFHSGQFEPEKAQMVQSREFEVKEAARITNIIASKLGDSSRTAYNTLEMEERFYHTSSLSHWFKAMQGEARVKLLTPEQRRTRSHDLKHDTELFLDAETRSKVGKTEIEMGVRSPNEYRVKMLKLPPRAGGDVYLTPLNMAPTVARGASHEETGKLYTAAKAPFAESLSRGIRRCLAAIRREVKQKTAVRFCDWFDQVAKEQLPEEMEEELLAASTGMANLLRMTPQALISEVSQTFLAPLFSDIRELLEIVSEDDLRTKVSLIADRHSQRHDDIMSGLEVDDEKAIVGA